MHTKELLKTSDIRPDWGFWGPILQTESGRIIAFLARHPSQHPKEEAIAQEQADAERLVASWNTLIGLEPSAIAGLVEAAEGALAVGQIVGDSKKRIQQSLIALKGGK